MSTTISVRLKDDTARWVKDQAKATGRSRASLINEALENERRIRTSGPNSFMSLAGALEGPKDLSKRKGFSRK